MTENKQNSQTFLIHYNNDYIPNIFGLVNNGAMCYLNSLIQSLMSCPSFNEFLIKNRHKYIENTIVIEYLDIYEKNKNLDMSIKIESGINLLKKLVESRIKMKSKYILSHYNQEDIHEGLILLLDSIGNDIDNLFHIRYKNEIKCLKCGHKPVPTQQDHKEPPEIMIDLSPSMKIPLTKLEFEEHIKKNIQIPQDYRCENCGIKNTHNTITKKTEKNILQIYSLARLSEIIIVLFKKYNRKENLFFPTKLNFNSTNGLLEYKLVSQVEHSGNMYGGHYWAKCLRNKPDNFHDKRIQKARTIINTMKTNILNENSIEKKQELEKKINLYEEAIKKESSDNDGIFLFNDSNVSYCQNGFEPTNNTYIVFYHLI